MNIYEQKGSMADNRYARGKIYKLVNNVDEEFYVGSTCTSLAKRLYGHKTKSKHTPLPAHRHFIEIGWDTVDIVLIEEYACSNKMELERRERYWIEDLKPSLNKNTPAMTVCNMKSKTVKPLMLVNVKCMQKGFKMMRTAKHTMHVSVKNELNGRQNVKHLESSYFFFFISMRSKP